MPSRLSEILSILASGEDGDSSVYDIFAKIFEGIDQRIAVIESVSGSLSDLQELLSTSAQGVVDAALDPVLSSISTKAELGALLTALSVSENSVGTGLKTFTVAPEAARSMFAPAHMLSVTATDDPTITMYGRRVSYDAQTGVLVVDVVAAVGAGTLTSWTIAPGSIAAMANVISVAAAGSEIAGPTLQVALGQIASALDARQPLAENLTDLAALAFVADMVLGTGSDGAPTQFAVSTYGKTLLSMASASALRSAIAAAPVSSPAFTGIPTVPTASVLADSNQIANITAVRIAVANLVNGSPAALDTLKEFATALGNDANFAATITAAIAAKAPLASPALTGTPTTPTASVLADSSQIANITAARAAAANAIQRGSNANGEYVRFTDGTQICWNRAVESVACETPSGTVFTSLAATAWTYPAAFVDTALVIPRSYGASARWATISSESATAAGLRVFSTVTSATLLPVGAIAIGRWK